MAQQDVPDIMNDHALAWLIVIPICSIETIACLFAIASRTHWKCPDVLLFSFVFIQLLYLMIPMLIYSINVRKNDVSIAVCRLVVWCVLSFRIMMSLHMTYLAMDRVWILKWPRAYHLHNTNRQSCKNSIFMWLFGMSMGAIGLSNWRESDQELFLKCGLVLYTPNYVYSLCVIIIILGSLVLGVMCVGTLVVDTIRTHESEPSIPTIIIEDEIGKKTQTIKVAKEEQNRQVNKIVCFIFSVYYVISVLPFVIVNLYSLANPVDKWMPIVIQWCTLIGYVINPILMGVVCDRYRKGYVRCLGNLGFMVDGKTEHSRYVPRQETLDSLDNVPPAENKLEFHSLGDVMDTWDEDVMKSEPLQQPGTGSPSSGHRMMTTLIIPSDDSFVAVQEYDNEESTFENEAYEKDREVKEHIINTKNVQEVQTRTSSSRQGGNNHRRQKRKSSNEEKIRRAKERYRRDKLSGSSQNDTNKSRASSSENDSHRDGHKDTNVSDFDTYHSSSSISVKCEELNKDTSADVSSSLYDIPEENLTSRERISAVRISGELRTRKTRSDSEKQDLPISTVSNSQTDSVKSTLSSAGRVVSSDENDSSMKISAREMREKFRESRQEAKVIDSSSSINSDTIIFV